MQHSDITLPIDNGTINIRVGAIIMKDGKFLMTGNPRVDYLCSENDIHKLSFDILAKTEYTNISENCTEVFL